MSAIQLYRDYGKKKFDKFRTEGTLIMPDGLELRTLERPWVNNEPFVSCIPEGTYRLHRDYHGKHRFYRIYDDEVDPRSAIEIHPALNAGQLQGCIAPCYELNNGIAARSLDACNLLLDWFNGDDWLLEISEA